MCKTYTGVLSMYQEDFPKYMRMKQLKKMIPVSHTTIWTWVKKNKFPKPIKIGANTTVWVYDEVKQYLDSMGTGEYLTMWKENQENKELEKS